MVSLGCRAAERVLPAWQTTQQSCLQTARSTAQAERSVRELLSVASGRAALRGRS